LKGWKFLGLLCFSLVLLSLVASHNAIGKEGEGGASAEQAQLEKAQQLYDEAVSLYKKGELEQAQAKFVEVREMPVDIGDRMRARVDKYLKRIEDKLRQRAEEEQRRAAEARAKEAAGILNQAESLFKTEKYAEAKPLYIKVKQMNVDLGWRGNRTLGKRLASIDAMIAVKQDEEKARAMAEAAKKAEEAAKAELTATFEQGEKLYKSGRYAAAKTEFEKVKASGVSLGRSVGRKISSYMKDIAKQEAKAQKLAELDAAYIMGDKLFKAGDFQGAIDLFRQVERSRDADDKLRVSAKDYRLRAEAKLVEAKQREKLVARLEEINEFFLAGKYQDVLKVAGEIEAAGISLGGEHDAQLNDYKTLAKAKLLQEQQRLERERREKELAEKQEAERLQAERNKREMARGLYDKAASLYSKRDYKAAKEAYADLKARSDYLSSRQNRTVEKRLSTIAGLIADQEAAEKATAEREAAEREKQEARDKAVAAFERGQKLYKAGSYAAAKAELEAVKASGVDLGWSANRRVSSYLDDIAEKEARARDEQNYQSLLAEAVGLHKAGDYRSAIELFREVEGARAAGSELRNKAKDYRKQAEAKLAEAERQQREEKLLTQKRAAEEEAVRLETERKKRQEAEKTFAEAKMLHRNGNLEEARTLFKKVRASGVSLGAKTDQSVLSYIDDIDRELAGRKEEEEKYSATMAVYKKAIKLLNGGKYEDAMALFQQVSESGIELSRDQRAELDSYVARAEQGIAELQVRREAEAQAKAVQERLAAISKLIEDSRPVEARAELDALVASGLPLTLEDERTIGELSQQVVQTLTPEQREVVAAAPRPRSKADLQRRYNALWEALKLQEETRRQEHEFRAQVLLDEAIALIDQQEFTAALEKLEEATELNPELEEAKEKKLMVQEILAIPPPYRPMSVETSMKEQIRRQAARIEVENTLAAAKSLYGEKKYDEAENLFRRVLQMISVLPAGVDMPKEQSEAESLLARTVSESEAAEKALQEQKRLDAQRDAERYARERQAHERLVVQEMLKTARAYFDDREYGKTETLCRIILEKDRSNATALALLEVAKEAMISLDSKELERDKYYAHEELEVESKKREIPLVKDVLDYPPLDEWQKKDEREPPAVIEEAAPGTLEPFDKYPTYPADTRVKTKPMTYQPDVDSRDIEDLLAVPVTSEVTRPEFALEEFEVATTVQEVLDEIALQTGLNIFLPSTLNYLGTPLADTPAPIFYLVDVPAGVFLDLILDPFGFGYQIANDNTITVVAKQDASKIFWKSYDLNHLLVNITDFGGVSGGIQPTLVTGGVTPALTPPTGGGAGFNASPKAPVDLVTLSTWIQTNVAPGTWVEPPAVATDPQTEVPPGIRVGTIQILQAWGGLLIRQTADVHAEIQRFLDTLAETIDGLMVISLEMRILTLDDATLEKIGVEWKGLDIAGDSFVDEGIVSNRSDLTSDLRFGSQPPLPLFGPLDTGAVATIDYSIIRDWAARVVVQMAQKIQGSEAVQAPRITFMQNQIATISINDQHPYVSDFTTDVSEDAVAMTPTISVVGIGVTFQALATISTDRKYVYLTVAPTFTDLKGFFTSKGTSTTSGTSSEVEVTIPIITSTTVNTTAKVPDGGTLVLGGLVRSSQTDAESRVPILSHIPIFGNLFRSHGKGGNRSTIILMITPHVVDYAEYEADIEFYGEIAPSRPPRPAEPVESIATPSIGG